MQLLCELSRLLDAIAGKCRVAIDSRGTFDMISVLSGVGVDNPIGAKLKLTVSRELTIAVDCVVKLTPCLTT